MDVEFLKHRFEDGHEGVITKSKFKIGVRHLQVLYMLVCSAVFGALRATGGIALLAVTDETRRNDTQAYIQIHSWDRRIQGSILSSYFFGFAIMSLPAEILLSNVGSNLLLTSVLLVDGALCVTMPTIINKGGWIAASNAQLLMGMTQACLSPVNNFLLAKWLPPNERHLFGGFVYSGIQLGIIIALPISGLLSKADLGWELIFYSEAMMAFSMAALWGLLTASTPAQHQAIGDKEKEFITECVRTYQKKSLFKPWRSIIESKNFWAVVCAHISTNVVFVFYLADIPAYLHALGLSLPEITNSMLFSFASTWIVYITTSPVVDWLNRTGCIGYVMNITYYRRLVNAVGAIGVVTGLIVVSNVDSRNSNVAIIVLTLTAGFLGFQYNGFLETFKDMSQNFSRTLLVLSSFVSSLIAATVPFVTGLIVGDDLNNLQRWRVVVVTLITFILFCDIAFTMFSSCEPPEWDGRRRGAERGYINEGNHFEMEDFQHSNNTRQQKK